MKVLSKVIFPGTFDPPTVGHLDIIKKAATLFGTVYVAIGCNPKKLKPSFSLDERLTLLRTITRSFPNVEVVSFNGLLVDFAKELEIPVILKAIRNTSDLDDENIQAEMNRQMNGIETLLMFSEAKFRLISSTIVREIASYGKQLKGLVPPEIEQVVFDHLFSLKK